MRRRLIARAFASSDIEPEIVAESEPVEVFPGLVIPVVRVGHLIALKLLSRDDQARPQDAVDLRALSGVAINTEVARATRAAELIEQRGFARGRDLRKALTEYRVSEIW